MHPPSSSNVQAICTSARTHLARHHILGHSLLWFVFGIRHSFYVYSSTWSLVLFKCPFALQHGSLVVHRLRDLLTSRNTSQYEGIGYVPSTQPCSGLVSDPISLSFCPSLSPDTRPQITLAHFLPIPPPSRPHLSKRFGVRERLAGFLATKGTCYLATTRERRHYPWATLWLGSTLSTSLYPVVDAGEDRYQRAVGWKSREDCICSCNQARLSILSWYGPHPLFSFSSERKMRPSPIAFSGLHSPASSPYLPRPWLGR